MKTNNNYSPVLIAMVLFLSAGLYAQEEIILNPAELVPHQDGYYIEGVWVDEDNDGNSEFHNQCDDYFEDDMEDGIYDPHVNHEETGEQQGFNYVNCLIMPTCEHKGTAIDPPVSTGYIQMSACLYSNTDSAIYSYIQTPPVKNLVSIYLETSSDVSINEKRQIPYNIEYSKDNGTTWENTFLGDKVAAQGGYRVTYDGSLNLEIKEMIDASKTTPIVLRIITNDREVESPNKGQFVKLHSLKLTADKVSTTDIMKNSNIVIKTKNHSIISENHKIEVYNIMGKFIGSGKTVSVPAQGIYLVKTGEFSVQKIWVK
jgi:hypothetical protein